MLNACMPKARRVPTKRCSLPVLFALLFSLGCDNTEENTLNSPATAGADGVSTGGMAAGGASNVTGPMPGGTGSGGAGNTLGTGGVGSVPPPPTGGAAGSAAGGASGGNPNAGGNPSTGGNPGTGGGPPVIPSFAKKNVLLIMADDMNDWAEPFGGHPQAKTPNIKKLADRGVVFKNAYSVVPVCQPSRTAMLLGLRPHTSTVWGNSSTHYRNIPALADRVTLPQFFQSQGYKTADAGKIFHVSSGGSDADSWDEEFAGSGGTKIPPGYTPTHGMVFSGYNAEIPWGLNWGPAAGNTEEQGDWLSAGYIAGQLEKAQDKPFFLAYGAHKPHLPMIVPQKYFDMFPLANIQLTDVDVNDLNDVPQNGLKGDHGHEEFLRTADKKNWEQGIQAYLASLAFADDCIGRVLDALENGPHKDNTIVLLMGDHGWHLGEKMHWGKATLWEEATKTPLIIYDPSIGRVGVVSEPVSLQDIYPTLVELNGLSGAPSPLAGRSIVPLLLDPQRTDQPGWALSSWVDGHEALRTERWSLIRHGQTVGSYQYELYDMKADPLQHTNLAKVVSHAQTVQLLSEDIDNIIKTNAPKNQQAFE
ncbi:MAG: hypothetical protein RJA70_251 [Pseudomonadota bacterium]|jgi:arylsulfatase A-like enzyme